MEWLVPFWWQSKKREVMKRHFKVFFLDDNHSFLLTFFHQLLRHAHSLELLWDCKVKMDAFTDTSAFLKSIDASVNVVFMDYKLNHGVEAKDVLMHLKSKGLNPKAIIFSEGNLGDVNFDECEELVAGVLRKDTLLIPRCCLLMEDYLFKA